MRVIEPAVLVGAYDWHAALVPRAEFEARIAAALARLAGTGAAGLVVYGNKIDNAALAYLTNFTPKIDTGLALVAPDGKVRVHGSGNPAMMVNGKRLTWVEDLRPLRDVAQNISEWAANLAPGELALWASPAMPADLQPRIEASLAGRKLRDAGALLDPLLRAKSPTEMRLLREAATMLAASVAALRESFRSGASARQSVVQAEEAAAAAGAQDVRVLASMSAGGTPTAIDYPQSGRLDPLLVYIAVRHAGYWAEGNVTLAASPGESLRRAEDALAAMCAAARIGAAVAEIKSAGQQKLGGLESHPAALPAVTGIGLSLVEAESEPSGVTRLEAGRVYSLHAGARGKSSDAALLSAMIEPKASAAEPLWSALA